MKRIFGKVISLCMAFSMLASVSVNAAEIDYSDYDFIGYTPSGITTFSFDKEEDWKALEDTLKTASLPAGQAYTTYVCRTRLYKNAEATDGSGNKALEWVSEGGVDNSGCLKFNKAPDASASIRTYLPVNNDATAKTRGMRFSMDVKCVGAQTTGVQNASCILRWGSNVNTGTYPATIHVRGAGDGSKMAIAYNTSSISNGGYPTFNIDGKAQLDLLNKWITMEMQINFKKQTVLLRAVNKETGELIGEAESSYIPASNPDAERVIQTIEIASTPNHGEVLVDNIKYEYDRYDLAAPEVKMIDGALTAYAKVTDTYQRDTKGNPIEADKISGFLPGKRLCLAVYDSDGALVKVEVAKSEDAEYSLTPTAVADEYLVEGVKCTLKMDATEENYTAKAMMWDSFETLAPLCAASGAIALSEMSE